MAFASHKATMCRKAAEVADNPLERESLLSSALLWDYLILLCRQNGVRSFSCVGNSTVHQLLCRLLMAMMHLTF